MLNMNRITLDNSQQLHQFFRYSGNDIPLISAHRGGAIAGYPENCIATFENTLRHTPAFFEVDPRLTKDEIIVLMHDATLDRTTIGTGRVADYKWNELKALRLKDAQGEITPYSIPTLEEVVTWSRGKTILNLDKKDVPLPLLAQKLREWKAEHNVMLTVHSAEQARFYYEADKNRMFSAFIRNRKEFDEYENSSVPWTQIMAYVGPNNQPPNQEMYDLLHSRGVMCMLSAAPIYDKLPQVSERKTAYQEIIRGGADVLETDLPIEAAAAIQSLLPLHSPKQRFFTKSE
jgi:glycerophosphoryl diester phosphodiesterase